MYVSRLQLDKKLKDRGDLLIMTFLLKQLLVYIITPLVLIFLTKKIKSFENSYPRFKKGMYGFMTAMFLVRILPTLLTLLSGLF
jgi:hypothetical protein